MKLASTLTFPATERCQGLPRRRCSQASDEHLRGGGAEESRPGAGDERGTEGRLPPLPEDRLRADEDPPASASGRPRLTAAARDVEVTEKAQQKAFCLVIGARRVGFYLLKTILKFA